MGKSSEARTRKRLTKKNPGLKLKDLLTNRGSKHAAAQKPSPNAEKKERKARKTAKKSRRINRSRK